MCVELDRSRETIRSSACESVQERGEEGRLSGRGQGLHSIAKVSAECPSEKVKTHLNMAGRERKRSMASRMTGDTSSCASRVNCRNSNWHHRCIFLYPISICSDVVAIMSRLRSDSMTGAEVSTHPACIFSSSPAKRALQSLRICSTLSRASKTG